MLRARSRRRMVLWRWTSTKQLRLLLRNAFLFLCAVNSLLFAIHDAGSTQTVLYLVEVILVVNVEESVLVFSTSAAVFFFLSFDREQLAIRNLPYLGDLSTSGTVGV